MTNDKLTGLALILAILVGLFAPAPAQAKTHKTNYGYTHHKAVHYYCPYTGCHKAFNKH